MVRSNKTNGFTLIELMLSMAFIGLLLIATVVTIIFVTNQYSKGITYKLINQSGRELATFIKRDADSVTGLGTTIVQPSDASGHLGRLCLGGYSYVWNEPENLRNPDGTPPVKYSDAPGESPIVMARVADGGGLLCRDEDNDGTFSVDIKKSLSSEMLPNDRGDYAIHDVSLRSIGDTGGRVYQIAYVIGTNQEGTINSALRCEAPGSEENNYNFCAINRFELMVQAGN